jgi:nitrous oxide reductase accessory protein NosL
MKRIIAFTTLLLLLFAAGPVLATELQDAHEHAACDYCGMNRVKFAHSRMLIEYQDGLPAALCSLHCAAIELALTIDKTPTAIKVGDFNSQQLINAETAFWVIGGKKPGVMTMRGKWAFSEKAAAEQFVASSGGIISDFDHAMRAAYEDMYKDTMMIRNKRAMKKKMMNHGDDNQRDMHHDMKPGMDNMKKDVM